MPALTRRRYLEHPDCWHVYYGDVRVGATKAEAVAEAERAIDRALGPQKTEACPARERSMTDQELLISTIRKAGQIIGEYIEPGPRDADETLARLIAVLDTQDLAAAIDRLEKGHGLRVVK